MLDARSSKEYLYRLSCRDTPNTASAIDQTGLPLGKPGMVALQERSSDDSCLLITSKTLTAQDPATRQYPTGWYARWGFYKQVAQDPATRPPRFAPQSPPDMRCGLSEDFQQHSESRVPALRRATTDTSWPFCPPDCGRRVAWGEKIKRWSSESTRCFTWTEMKQTNRNECHGML